METILSYAANFLAGLSGWIILFVAVKFKQKNSADGFFSFLQNAGVVAVFILPFAISFLSGMLPIKDNILKKAVYGNAAFDIAFYGPFIIFIFLKVKRLNYTGKRIRFLAGGLHGIRKTVDFYGENTIYKVGYAGLEVFEDPQNNEKAGAGAGFNGQFTEIVSTGDDFSTPYISFSRRKCRKCGSLLDRTSIHGSFLEKKYELKGMKPFVKRVEGLFYICGGCNHRMVVNFEAYLDADKKALGNGKILLP